MANSSTNTKNQNAGAFEWSSAVEDLAEKNMRRTTEMLKCRSQIRYFQKRLAKLERQHRRCQVIAKVRLSATQAWPGLPNHEKWEKEIVLAALRSDCITLPVALQEKHWETSVPSKLRHDRDLLLARLARCDFGRHYRQNETAFELPTEYIGDKDVMLALIEVYPEILADEYKHCWTEELLDDEVVLRRFLYTADGHFYLSANMDKFSARLRGNKHLMLHVLRHSWSCLSRCTAELRDDRRFAMQVVHTSPNLKYWQPLKFLSKRLQDDKGIVMLYCGTNGSNLKHASVRLRKNHFVVHSAVSNQPSAIRHALPSKTKAELLANGDFLRKAHERIAECSNFTLGDPTNKKLWEACDAKLKLDFDLCVVACSTGSMPVVKVPGSLAGQKSFWLAVVTKEPRIFKYLQSPWKKNLQVAATAARHCCRPIQHHSIAFNLCRQFPELLSDRLAMMAVAKCCDLDEWMDTLLADPESTISNDKAIILQAAARNGLILDHLSPTSPLLHDREIVAAALQSPSNTVSVLRCISPHVQHMCSDLVAGAILRDNDLRAVAESIDENLWSVRCVALAWVSAGGRLEECPHYDFEDDDEELLMLLAEQHRAEEFWSAINNLEHNKEFMLKAVERFGGLFKKTRGIVQQDCFDLALIAFAGTRGLVEKFDSMGAAPNKQEDFIFLTSFARQVRGRIQTYEGFLKQVLCGVNAPATSSTTASIISPCSSTSSCPLSLLNQGQETTMTHVKCIAEYLGVSTGKELRLLRQASANLVVWGF